MRNLCVAGFGVVLSEHLWTSVLVNINTKNNNINNNFHLEFYLLFFLHVLFCCYKKKKMKNPLFVRYTLQHYIRKLKLQRLENSASSLFFSVHTRAQQMVLTQIALLWVSLSTVIINPLIILLLKCRMKRGEPHFHFHKADLNHFHTDSCFVRAESCDSEAQK